MALAALALFQQHALSLGLRKKRKQPKERREKKRALQGEREAKEFSIKCLLKTAVESCSEINKGWFEAGELAGRTHCSHVAKCFPDHLSLQGWVSRRAAGSCHGAARSVGVAACIARILMLSPGLEQRLRVSWGGGSP